jgi:hypothetical protein
MQSTPHHPVWKRFQPPWPGGDFCARRATNGAKIDGGDARQQVGRQDLGIP